MFNERIIESFDGTSLYTSSEGDGPALVLCDGIGCAGFIWRYMRLAFKNRYRIIHWNYRAHGKSGPPARRSSMRMEDLVDDLQAIINAYELKQPVLIGHSLGAQVILTYALMHPKNVGALVSLCGSAGHPLRYLHDNGYADKAFPYLRTFQQAFPRFSQRAWERVLKSELAYQFALRFEVTALFARRSDFSPYFRQVSRMDVGLFTNLLYHANRHSIEERLPEISHPTLVVGGERDTFTPGWRAKKMAQSIPNAELCMVPGGSHVAPIELPELINLRLEQFLEKRLGLLDKKKATARSQKVGKKSQASKTEKKKVVRRKKTSTTTKKKKVTSKKATKTSSRKKVSRKSP